MPDDSGRPLRSLRLATELRRLRERTGRSGDDVALELGWSGSKISRIERNRTGVRLADLERLLDIYEVGEARRRELLQLASEVAQVSQKNRAVSLTFELAELIGLEREAELHFGWEPQIVPGLLQTEDYARALMSGFQRMFRIPPGELERQTQLRLARQQRLTASNPLQVSFVIDESVLHRRFGHRATMKTQLDHLAEAALLPNVQLRVMPLDAHAPIGTGSFTYMSFARVHDVRLPDIVLMEQLVTGYRADDEDDTHKYRIAFEHLVETALPPDQTRELILSVARRVWG